MKEYESFLDKSLKAKIQQYKHFLTLVYLNIMIKNGVFEVYVIFDKKRKEVIKMINFYDIVFFLKLIIDSICKTKQRQIYREKISENFVFYIRVFMEESLFTTRDAFVKPRPINGTHQIACINEIKLILFDAHHRIYFSMLWNWKMFSFWKKNQKRTVDVLTIIGIMFAQQ